MGTTLLSNGVLLPRVSALELTSNTIRPMVLEASKTFSSRKSCTSRAGSSNRISFSRRLSCSPCPLAPLQGLRSGSDADGHFALSTWSRGRNGLTCRADSSAAEKPASAVTDDTTDGKWRSTVTRVIPAPIDKVWSILADFSALHTHFPQVFQSCENVDGEPNKVGALRSAQVKSSSGFVIKVKERLLALDNTNYTQSYAMEDNNVGWTGYVSHVKAKSIENDQTHVDWYYEVDPVSNKTKEKYLPTQDGLFSAMLAVVKKTLAS